ncbi:MAG: 3-methyl-2-oxobutanoate hydroxymethyltransferase [Planctomycetota bacterium]
MPAERDDASPEPVLQPVRLRDVQQARDDGRRMAMLTCYDFTTAVHLQQCGVELLLVGDSAANVVLGHERTTAIDLDTLITLGTAVRRGATASYVMVDMPFGSYHADAASAVANVCRMVRETGCDSVKLEVTRSLLPLVTQLADAGVAVCCHLGLRPQSVQRSGYRIQAADAGAAEQLAKDAEDFEYAGAATLLLEAVPPEASRLVVERTAIPVIGCGAGPSPMAHVVVLTDLLGLSNRRPKFVPDLGQPSLRQAASAWVTMVRDGSYPAGEHLYLSKE